MTESVPMDTPNYPCDMHCHTTRSDGNDTPLELIDNAVALGMAAVAITDHDIDPPQTVTLPDGKTCDIISCAKQKGLTLIPGYEFSCDTYVDDVHICGYDMDWSHPDLQAEIEAAKRSKSDGYKELCRRLTADGMAIDWEQDVLTYTAADGKASRRRDDEVQRKHIFEAMAARGYTPTWSDAKILVRDNANLNVPRRKIEPVAAIELIHRCGGVAILAHPYLIDEEVHPAGLGTMCRADYIHKLFDAGLDGIEVRYPYDKTSYKGTMTPEEIEQDVRRLFGSRARILSGGSDYHADHKKGGKKVRAIGERGLSAEEFQAAFGAIL